MAQTRSLGLALIIIGALLLVGAAFAYTYAQTHTLNVAGVIVSTGTVYPYQNDSFGLIIGGIALFVVGFALMVFPSQKQNPPPPPIVSPPIAYCCKTCGAGVSPNQKYCPDCGRQLEWH